MSEYTFEPFQKVLVRDENDDRWEAEFFSHNRENREYPYRCIGRNWKKCIPYEGNEHLLGKIDAPKPKWKPKPGELVAVTDSLEETWRARRFFARNETLFLCYREKGLETEGWLFCEPLRKHFNMPEE